MQEAVVEGVGADAEVGADVDTEVGVDVSVEKDFSELDFDREALNEVLAMAHRS